MKKTDDALIKFWKQLNTGQDSNPFIAEQDMSSKLEEHIFECTSYEDYVESKAFGSEDYGKLHVGLLPIPYMGDLLKSSIYILMLNPGLGHADYYGEYNSIPYRDALIGNIRQESNRAYPFACLNPLFSWHGGFVYWQRKLNGIALEYKKQKNVTYQDALKQLSTTISSIELMPYHSTSFGASKLLDAMVSVNLSKSFVQEILVPKAKCDKATIIVMRGVTRWDLPDHKNIVKYTSGEARAASLSLKSPGGAAIARRLGLVV